jgi:hypothetical protein
MEAVGGGGVLDLTKANTASAWGLTKCPLQLNLSNFEVFRWGIP